MNVLKTIAVAFSMFSAIPVPQFEWNRSSMRYCLCAFPMVGVVIALCEWGWARVCVLLPVPMLLRGAILCLLPVLITGGIHLDGYADTCDALASHAGWEKRREILRDPHIGTFAVIRLVMYLIAGLALWTALAELKLPVLIGLFCLPRVLSALSLTLFPLREDSSLARTFAEAADRTRVKTLLLVMAGLLVLGLLLLNAWEMLPVAAVVFAAYRRVSEKGFGGLSGDLAGWFLQTAELWMLAALVLRQLVEAGR